MTLSLKPYPEYKESGLPWLGKIPVHWGVLRSKYVFREIDVRSATGQEVHLSMSQKHGLIPSSQIEERRLVSESYVGAKVCERRDLVLNRLKAHLGVFALANQSGLVSPDYTVFRPRSDFSPQYFLAALRTPQCRSELRKRAKGIVEGFWRLYTEDFFQIALPIPPKSDQERIVRFFSHFDRLITRLIRAKRRLIELLNEQKQVIIHRAVTRGLDPNVRLKPSGIEWLGDMPEHWETCPLKQLLSRMDYGTSANLGSEGPIRVLTMAHIQDGQVSPPAHGSLEYVANELFLHEKDLLFNRTNSPDLVGKVGIFRGTFNDRVTFASYLVRLQVKPENDPEWLNLLLNSAVFWGYARSQALLSLHQANLNSTRYGQMRLPQPPKSDQREIANSLEAQTQSISQCADSILRQIDLLREYRARLIADVVTGKLDVRGVELPKLDEAESVEDLDNEEETEADDMLEDDPDTLLYEDEV